MPDELDFEKPLLELENRIAELRTSDDALSARDEIARLEERLARQQQRVYSSLTFDFAFAMYTWRRSATQTYSCTSARRAPAW